MILRKCLKDYKILQTINLGKWQKMNLKKIYKNIIKVQLDKSNNVYGMFDRTIDDGRN